MLWAMSSEHLNGTYQKYYYWWLKMNSISTKSRVFKGSESNFFGTIYQIETKIIYTINIKLNIFVFCLLEFCWRDINFELCEWCHRNIPPGELQNELEMQSSKTTKMSSEKKTDNFFNRPFFTSFDRKYSEFWERKILNTAGSLFQIGYIVGFVLYFHFNDRNNAQKIHRHTYNRSTLNSQLVSYKFSNRIQFIDSYIYPFEWIVGWKQNKNKWKKNKRNQMASPNTDDDDNDSNKPEKAHTHKKRTKLGFGTKEWRKSAYNLIIIQSI